MSSLKDITFGRALAGDKGKRFKKPPVTKRPLAIEKQYSLLLRKRVRLLFSVVRDNITKAVPDIQKQINADGWSEDFNAMMLDIENQFSKTQVSPTGVVDTIGDEVDVFNAVEWQRVMKIVMGVAVFSDEKWKRDVLGSWVSDNTLLIKDIEEKALVDVRGTISRGFSESKSSRTIAKEIFGLKDSVLSKSLKRADLIAVDQVGKLNADLTRNRHKDIGVDDYRWRNMRDRRVRGNPNGLYPRSAQDHWRREGKLFSWDKPPTGGHPGYAVRCRCYAEANFDELEAEVLALEKESGAEIQKKKAPKKPSRKV